MSDAIDRQKLLEEIIKIRDEEKRLKAYAFRHKHYEEGNMHNHGVQIINRIVLIMRGMEAEDAETKTD